MLAVVTIKRGKTWWSLIFVGGVLYAGIYSLIANEGWRLLSFFGTLGALYLIAALVLAIGSLLLLPFKKQLDTFLDRFSPQNGDSPEKNEKSNCQAKSSNIDSPQNTRN